VSNFAQSVPQESVESGRPPGGLQSRSVGLIAGWLAGQIVQGTGFGIIGDLIVGIVGAFIGSWLLPQLGIHLGAGIVAAIINATVGALILLLIIRLVRGGGGWRGNWGRR
jgi:uncharacterized membrane protein YeaQ/YmgE (transglycosylase-associated protein family)